MICKLIGAILVIGSATLIGWGFSECMIARERELLNLADAVSHMADELGYTLEPVKHLFLKVAPYAKGDAATLFENINDLAQNGSTAAEAWCAALEENAPSMSLKKSDCDYLTSCSDAFLAYDAGRQKLQLDALSDKICALAREAGEDKKKNCRLVRMLGVYGGVLICAILF